MILDKAKYQIKRGQLGVSFDFLTGINLKLLGELPTKSSAWLLLAFSAFSLELSALFFQYYMDLAPCIMCIYQRVAIWGVFFAGVIGYFGHQLVSLRILAYISWAIGAIWGLLIAIEHVEVQNSNSLFYSCEYVPNFPTWLPLHELLPWLFEATGDCGDINWQFFGYSMPQIMIVTYTIYIFILAVVLMTRLYFSRKL